MNKVMRLLTTASVFTLVACGEGSSVTNDSSVPEPPQTPTSNISFQPANGILSVPNDLLFSGTTDGTLEVPDEVAGRAAGGADYRNPSVALGGLDGWSTQIPFQLAVDMAESATINAATLTGNVRIFETYASDGVNCNGNPTTIPAGLPCAPTGTELTFGVDFVTQATASSIIVVPLRPLTPATTYVVALLDGIEDSRGELIQASATYQSLKDTTETLDPSTSIGALQGAISIYEGMVAAATSGTVTSDGLIYTMAMTTQSVGVDLGVIKTLLTLSPPSVSVTATGQTVRAVLDAALGTDPGAAFDLANYYTGSITLPYYLAIPTVENPLAPLTDPWRALCDNGVLLASGATGTPGPNDAACTGFGLRDFGLDADRHMTQYNPVPEARAAMAIDVQMTVPAAGCGGGACPVVIMQHGITSDKEAMLLMTASLSAAGFATVAIDHPLHGSRGFDVDGDLTDDINASTVSATHYMNLAALLVARDNLKQSIADMLGLRRGLESFTASDGTTLDTSNVYVVGLSLGGISSTGFVTLANSTVDPTFNVSAMSIHSAGGGIAPFLVESGSFGPLVQGSVLSQAGTTLADDFNTFLTTPDASCAALTPGSEAYISCQFTAFTGQLTAAEAAELSATISAFTFASQTIIDAGDPNNFAAGLMATSTPILMTEIVGNGADNLPDQVIPIQTVNAPLGGSEPLAALIGLSPIDVTTVGSGLVRFTNGHHGSLLDPGLRPEAPDAVANAAVTTEIQAEAAGFFGSGGTTIPITDPTYIQTVP